MPDLAQCSEPDKRAQNARSGVIWRAQNGSYASISERALRGRLMNHAAVWSNPPKK
jgi:hypothetical protein